MVALRLENVKPAMDDTRDSPKGSGLDDVTSRINQIADAATRLFARYGYKRSSMDDIAREAGLAKATLYLHFKGKDDVFRAMLDLLARRVEARSRDVLTMSAPFVDRLAAMLRAQHGLAYASCGTGEHLAELKAVMASIAVVELKALENLFVDYMKRLFTAAESAGEIDVSRSGVSLDDLVANLMFAAYGAKLGEPPSADVYAQRLDSIAKIFAAGISR